MTKKKPSDQQKKRGRKKIPIDLEKAENMAALMCSHEEIAAVLGVSVSVLEHNPEFMQIHKKGMERGRASLRSFQFQLAKAGNPTMNIWLGKQYLGQRDKQEIVGVDNSPLIPAREMSDEEIERKARAILDRRGK